MIKDTLWSGSTMVAFLAKALKRGRGRGILRRLRSPTPLLLSLVLQLLLIKVGKEREERDLQHSQDHSVFGWHPKTSSTSFPDLLVVHITGQCCQSCYYCRPYPRISHAPLVVLGGDLHFSRGVQVDLSLTVENLLAIILYEDMLLAGIEMQCRGLFMTRLAANVRGRRVKENSRLEHLWRWSRPSSLEC